MAHRLRNFITLLAVYGMTQVTALAAPAEAPVKPAEKPKNTTDKPKAAKPKVAAEKPHAKIMVPPPPPEIPLVTGRDGSLEFSTMGVPIDLMSAKDLDRMKTRLQTNLDLLSKKADERNSDINDGKARVAQFEQLFSEGVVSKKDLKNAKRDLETLELTDSDIDMRIADVKSDLARVDKRLKSLASKKDASAKKTVVKTSTSKHI